MNKVNWNSELRKISRDFDGLPPEPSAEEVSAQQVADQRAQTLRQNRNAVLGVWARLLLVGLLSAGVLFWPYPRACGFGLYSYLGAGAAIVLGGLWAAIFGWRFHMSKVHVLALAMMLWGGILITAQVLPRTAYARDAATWRCAVR